MGWVFLDLWQEDPIIPQILPFLLALPNQMTSEQMTIESMAPMSFLGIVIHSLS